MCGIAGIVAENSKRYEVRLRGMTEKLTHRGPDAEGFYFFENCALGHRRLSIIDLKTGDQPMTIDNIVSSQDPRFRFSAGALDASKLAVVFNGEIYGYKEIKKQLSDYKFQTTSDTEVILALYQKYGEEMMPYLPGMFAFALWDDREQKLFCARDRFGEKPFYYARGKNEEFIFASEIKAIIASGLINPVLDLKSIACYLKHLYIYPTRTTYRNVYILPAGHKLIWKNGKVKIERYWRLPAVDKKITLDEATSVFKDLLNKAVQRQLVADVPLGALLSGGLDSSTIVAIASKFKPKIKTFSFAFRDSINEAPFAREIAIKYDTDHIELFDDREDLGELLIKMQEIYDEPFGDSSNIPTYLISKLARRHTKVVLTGDGGDELFGGYGWYKPFLYINSNGGAFLRSELARFVSRALRRISGSNLLLQKVMGARFKKEFSSAIEVHLVGENVILSNKEIGDLGLEGFDEKMSYQPGWQETNDLNDIFRCDLENYITGDILVKTDRASMANGLELRAPFLDIDFASFCVSLPYQLKVSKESDKIILRRAVGDLWTRSIGKRAKQGFGAPIAKWLNDKSVAALKEDYLRNPKRKIFDIISFGAVQSLSAKNNYKTWALLNLSLWLEYRALR